MDEYPLLSHVCGENIRLSEGKSEAIWDSKYSGGIVFSAQALRYQEQIRIVLLGSSHVDIGVTQIDPESLRGPGSVRRMYLSEKCSIINNIRVHKQKCEVFLKNLKDKVISPAGNNTYGVSVDPKMNVWLVVCIKFGSASVTIDSPDMFHDVTGENIEFEGTQKQTAKLKVVNPASVCIIDRHLTTAGFDPVRIGIDPLPGIGGTPPHIYYVKLGLTSVQPGKMAELDPQSLVISKPTKTTLQNRWIPVQTFERRNQNDCKNSSVDKCKGELTIKVNTDGEMLYEHSSGIHGKWPITDQRLFIVLELFRVSVKMLSPLQRKDSTYEHNRMGKNAHSMENRQQEADDEGGYLRPLPNTDPESEPSRPVSSPCESSWHDWSNSWLLLERISSLEFDAKEKPAVTLEQKMNDTIKEMSSMKMPDDNYMKMYQLSDKKPHSLPTNAPSPHPEDMLRQIYTKMDNIEAIISQLQYIGEERHNQMFASYKRLKEVVEGIAKANANPDMVPIGETIRENYMTLLEELKPSDLVFTLYQKKIIDIVEKQRIQEMCSKGLGRKEINDKLLDLISQRLVSRTAMMEALQLSNQAHLKDKMLP